MGDLTQPKSSDSNGKVQMGNLYQRKKNWYYQAVVNSKRITLAFGPVGLAIAKDWGFIVDL